MSDIPKNCARSSRCFVAALAILWLTGGSATAQLIGDANGDGELNLADAAFIQAAIEGGAAQTAPFALSDVAHPCDGNINDADFALVERAARAGERATPVQSICHGGLLGEPLPPAAEVGDPLTLDEQFLLVADQVPEFGGVYLDESNRPVLMLTKNEPEVYNDAVAALVDVFGYERFNTEEFGVAEGRYGFEELHGHRLAALSLFSNPWISAIDTHEVSNRLWIGLTSWDGREEIETELERAGIPREVVVLEEVGKFVDHQVAFDLFERPVVGGIGGAGCTAGPIVNRGGVRGLLTNSHCSAVPGVVDFAQFHQNTNSGTSTLVGIETFDAPLFTKAQNSACPSGETCRWADALFASSGFITGTRRGAIKNSYNPASYPNRFVQAIEMAPLCGDQVRKSGAATGRTEGEVINTCFDGKSASSGLVNLCSYRISATSFFGDSGSPIYHTDYFGPVGAQLFGMLWGGNDTSTAFSPLSGILAQLGSMDFLSVQEPPALTILNPLDNSSIGTGSSFPITLTASVNDFEDGFACAGCQVTWTSSADGFLGTVAVAAGTASLSTELFGPGSRVLTATAEDSNGAKSVDTITVYTGNSPPAVWIEEPQAPAQVPLGVGVTFSGSSSDPENFGAPLGCGSLLWTSSVAGDPAAIDCSAVFTFNSLGWRKITLTGFDSQMLPAYAYIWVEVVPLAQTGEPIISMVQPQVNQLLARQSFHSLQGYATDPDGKSPIQYEWVLKGPGLIGGTNGEVTVGTTSGASGVSTQLQWKPSDYVIESCGGIVLDLELRATDPDNEQAALPRQITVSGPLC
ncbi:MAG: hypothetical protein K0U98_13655 [Deltaproteobacteria bacterium]|nr:hypothetical protein [Deltaproteobacteria bacterium]